MQEKSSSESFSHHDSQHQSETTLNSSEIRSTSDLSNFKAIPSSRKRHLYFVLITLAIFAVVYAATGVPFFAYVAMSTYAGYIMIINTTWYDRYLRFMYWPGRILTTLIAGRRKANIAENLTYNSVISPAIRHMQNVGMGIISGFFTDPFYIVYRLFRFFKPKEEVPTAQI